MNRVNVNEFYRWKETVFSLYTFFKVLKKVAKIAGIIKYIPLDVSQLPDRYRTGRKLYSAILRTEIWKNRIIVDPYAFVNFKFSVFGSVGDPDP